MHDTFTEFATLLLICALIGAVFVRLRQPVLIAYIFVGVVVGPAVLGLVTAQDQIDLLAQVGVAVLLFAVGLKLDLNHIRHIGPVALATGLGQLTFTIVIAPSSSSSCCRTSANSTACTGASRWVSSSCRTSRWWSP